VLSGPQQIVLEATGLRKTYGKVQSLKSVDLAVAAGEVHCLLGDNGAGKSTLIKLLSGVCLPTAGNIKLFGRQVQFQSPREALGAGIATVYQDLAVIPLMSIERNFFLGREPVRGIWPFRQFDLKRASAIVKSKMANMGIDLRSTEQMAGTLSGGERQSLAIARAMFFGAKVLILDEPTSALGVSQTAKVLKVMLHARNQGIAVIYITHNVRHAFAVGDRFTILQQGSSRGTYEKSDLTVHQLQDLMAQNQSLNPLADLPLDTI